MKFTNSDHNRTSNKTCKMVIVSKYSWTSYWYDITYSIRKEWAIQNTLTYHIEESTNNLQVNDCNIILLIKQCSNQKNRKLLDKYKLNCNTYKLL